LIPGETRQVALRWTLYDGLHMPFFDVDTAQNWEGFRKAFSQLDAPGQNVFTPMSTGTLDIRRPATFRFVRRRWQSAGQRADDAHEWISYIPFDKLPRIYNPPSGSSPRRTGASRRMIIPIP